MTTVSPLPDESTDLLGELCDLLEATVTQPSPELVVIAVCGELDMASGELLRSAIARALALEPKPKRVLVDLAAVTFCGSVGLGVLTQGRALASAQGVRLQLRGAVHRAVAMPLRVTGLENHFDIID